MLRRDMIIWNQVFRGRAAHYRGLVSGCLRIYCDTPGARGTKQRQR